jgi:hypothetical protein
MDEISTPDPVFQPGACLVIDGTIDAQTKLFSELALARCEFGDVEKDREGQYGHQKFKYATLGMLTAATARPLAAHGITILQFFNPCPYDASKQRLTTIVAGHGARIATSLDFDPRLKEDERSGIKEYGKLRTYLRRYEYQAVLVLDAEPDADEAPVEPRREPRREPPRVEPRPEPKPLAKTAPKADQAPPSEPAVAESKVDTTEVQEEPADQDMLNQLMALRNQLGWSKMKLSQICADEWGIQPATIAQSMRTARTVMERMQHAILDQQKGAA